MAMVPMVIEDMAMVHLVTACIPEPGAWVWCQADTVWVPPVPTYWEPEWDTPTRISPSAWVLRGIGITPQRRLPIINNMIIQWNKRKNPHGVSARVDFLISTQINRVDFLIFQERKSARRSAGFEIRRQKMS